jgi:hypothetical protein
VFLIHQLGMMSTEVFSFRKVSFLLIDVNSALNVWSERIYNGGQRMVRRCPNHLDVYLKLFQGDPA